LSQVLGFSSQGLVSLASPSGMSSDAIYRQSLSNNAWSSPSLLDGTGGKRDWPVTKGGLIARWLDSGGVQVLGSYGPPSGLGAVQRPGSSNWYFLTPSGMSWADAEAYAVQNGGHLVTIDDSAENQWIQSNYASLPMWVGLFRDPGSDLNAGWKWSSGLTSSYRSWASGEPNNAGGAGEYYGSFGTNGLWNDAIGSTSYRGLVEVDGLSSGARTLAEPAATAKLVWRGHSLALGNLRASGGTPASIILAFIDDKNTSGGADVGDDFVIAEYDLALATPIQRTLTRISITSPSSSGAYALTCLHRMDSSKPDALLVGEPDGTVSVWSAADPYSPLVRTVLSAEFKGKTWHQFEALKGADGREGLVGLVVDPANPAQSQLIYWGPDAIESLLGGTSLVLNNLPLAKVLASPSSGAAQSTVGVRTWDAEAHASAIALQYQKAGQSTWSAATLLSADGSAGNLDVIGKTKRLATAPGGQSHTLIWNAAADLGPSFVGTVLLRTMATDADAGAWSAAMPYTVDMASSLDDDCDGFTNANELAFGTDPNSAASRPLLTATRLGNGSLQLTWPSAAGHTYRLETSLDLSLWTPLQTGLPTGSANIPAGSLTAPKRFYRVAAE